MITPNSSQRRFGRQRDVATSQSQKAATSTTPSKNLGKKSGRIKSYCFNCVLTTHLINDCAYPMQGKIKKLTSLIQQLLWSHQRIK